MIFFVVVWLVMYLCFRIPVLIVEVYDNLNGWKEKTTLKEELIGFVYTPIFFIFWGVGFVLFVEDKIRGV